MALLFPSSPSTGQTYQSGSSATFVWTGTYWESQKRTTEIDKIVQYSEDALLALTSSLAATASYVTTASYAYSSSYVVSSSYTLSSSYALSSSYSVTSLYAVSASLAQTSSYVQFADTSQKYISIVPDGGLGFGVEGFSFTYSTSTNMYMLVTADPNKYVRKRTVMSFWTAGSSAKQTYIDGSAESINPSASTPVSWIRTAASGGFPVVQSLRSYMLFELCTDITYSTPIVAYFVEGIHTDNGQSIIKATKIDNYSF